MEDIETFNIVQYYDWATFMGGGTDGKLLTVSVAYVRRVERSITFLRTKGF